MADRIEREIEEILARLDKELPEDGARPVEPRAPISIAARRKTEPARARISAAKTRQLPAVTPTTLLFAGAGIMLAGLILASFVDAAIWVAFAGVVVFLGAFAWSFVKRPTVAQEGPGKVFWRDRYIEYSSQPQGWSARLRRRFRR